MINAKQLNEKISKASSNELRTILTSVFDDTFNYDDKNLLGSVQASIHMTENEGNEHIIEWTNKEIMNLLNKKT